MAATLSANSMRILTQRYLNGNNETVDDLWDRVSGGNPIFRNLMAELRFLPNSPTLFNMGLNNGCTSSACFVFDVEDSMFGKGSITDTRDKAIAVAKAGGGVGYYFGKLREKGAPIKSIHRKACGPVTVLRDYHGISRLITQGGKRELAQMGVLPVWHPDIREFIHCKDDDPQGLGSFNISVSWTKEWVDKVDFYLISTGPLMAVERSSLNNETSLWIEQCESAWRTGCPGMFFPDTVNHCNPNLDIGYINAPNPCGETPNRSGEPCNLGSLALTRYFVPTNRSINWDLLEEDTYNGILFMDDILDRNTFPHPDITSAANRTRKLGLGVMGWADLLAMLHIPYDSDEAIALASKLMKFIQDVSHQASWDLVHKMNKRPYEGYDPDRTDGPCRRNETTTSIAPTGTIALIADLFFSQSIEPHPFLAYERTTAEGIKLREEMDLNKFDGFVPRVAHDIHWSWHVKHQAAFQEFTDLGVSKTINLPNSATVKDVSDAYRMMYSMGCKGGTVFRDGCRGEQVIVEKKRTKSVFMVNLESHESENQPDESEKIRVKTNPIDESQWTLLGVDHTKEDKVAATIPPKSVDGPANEVNQRSNNVLSADTPFSQRRLPARRNSITHKVKICGTAVYITVGLFPEDNSPAELFVTTNKLGSSMEGMTSSWGRLFSVALQNGVPLKKLVRKHLGVRFEPCGLTNNPHIPVCTSIPDYVVRWLAMEFLAHTSSTEVQPDVPPKKVQMNHGETITTESGMFCPQCGAEAIYQAGCLICPMTDCGWNRCG